MTPENDGATDAPSPASADDLDYSDFSASERAQRARARRRRTLLQVAIGAATVAIPLVYLYAKGDLKGLRHPVTAVVVPSSQAVAKQNILVTHPASSPADKKRDAAVAADLQDYLSNGIQKLKPTEQAALSAYASATGKNYTGEANSFRIVREQVVPKYIEFVKQAAHLKPKTAEVQALQALFLNSIELRLLAYRQIADAEHTKGDAWHLTVGAELQASDIASQKFKDATITLADHANVKLPD